MLFLIVLSPRPHGIQNRFQAFAEFRQRILHPRRYFGVDLTVNKTAFLHSPELNGEDLLGYIAHGLFQFAETLCPRQQIAQDQNLPLISNQCQGRFYRAGGKFRNRRFFIAASTGFFSVTTAQKCAYFTKEDYGIIIVPEASESKPENQGGYSK